MAIRGLGLRICTEREVIIRVYGWGSGFRVGGLGYGEFNGRRILNLILGHDPHVVECVGDQPRVGVRI